MTKDDRSEKRADSADSAEGDTGDETPSTLSNAAKRKRLIVKIRKLFALGFGFGTGRREHARG